MPSTMSDLRRARLAKRIAALEEQYEAAGNQLNAERNDDDQVIIGRKLEKLEAELEKLYSQLQECENIDGPARWRFTILQANLPKIDFRSVKKALDQIFDKTGKEGCAGIFFLERGQELGGEQCGARIRDLLNERTGELKDWPVDCAIGGGSTDEFSLLRRIGRHLNVTVENPDLQQSTEQLVAKICASMPSGSIALLDVRGWDNLFPPDRVLNWFLDGFWKRIVDALPTIRQDRRGVRFFALLQVDGDFPKELLPAARLCTADKFEDGKILRIRLKNWTEREIEDWITTYSRLSAQDIDRLLKKVWLTSRGGVPLLVCQTIYRELRKCGELRQ
jgi:hypothetical protein